MDNEIIHVLINLKRQEKYSHFRTYTGITFPDLVAMIPDSNTRTMDKLSMTRNYINGSTLMLPSTVTNRDEYEIEAVHGPSRNNFKNGIS